MLNSHYVIDFLSVLAFKFTTGVPVYDDGLSLGTQCHANLNKACLRGGRRWGRHPGRVTCASAPSHHHDCFRVKFSHGVTVIV